MAIGIHFDDDNYEYEEETMAIGIGHKEDKDEEFDYMTMGIGIGHKKENNK